MACLISDKNVVTFVVTLSFNGATPNSEAGGGVFICCNYSWLLLHTPEADFEEKRGFGGPWDQRKVTSILVAGEIKNVDQHGI